MSLKRSYTFIQSNTRHIHDSSEVRQTTKKHSRSVWRIRTLKSWYTPRGHPVMERWLTKTPLEYYSYRYHKPYWNWSYKPIIVENCHPPTRFNMIQLWNYDDCDITDLHAARLFQCEKRIEMATPDPDQFSLYAPWKIQHPHNEHFADSPIQSSISFGLFPCFPYVFHMGVSENSVSLNPMVFMIIIPMQNGYFIGNIPHFQTNPYVFNMFSICFPYVFHMFSMIFSMIFPWFSHDFPVVLDGNSPAAGQLLLRQDAGTSPWPDPTVGLVAAPHQRSQMGQPDGEPLDSV